MDELKQRKLLSMIQDIYFSNEEIKHGVAFYILNKDIICIIFFDYKKNLSEEK